MRYKGDFMYNLRRERYLEQIEDQSLSLFFSGRAPQKSADQNYPFSVNRNFYYLTGIDQENVILLLAKGNAKTTAYLFIAKNDPLKVLWDGAGLTFEQASEISKIDLVGVKDINTLDKVIAQLLSTSRGAVYGVVEQVYLDLERQNELALDTIAISYAHLLKKSYPFIDIKKNQAVVARLRMVKDKNEINLIKEAISITAAGLSKIMSTLKPGLKEYEVQAEYNHILNKNRVTPSFDIIAASGKNATVLHYIQNDGKINNNDLILFDLGVDYKYYCSDVSRVYPASGTFSKRQKQIYEIVLKANKETIKWVKPGITMQEFNKYGKDILIQGAKEIGLIKEDQEIDKYYYHSLGHYLGLDVHDVCDVSLAIPVGAVITVEPGLYIAEEGIGIRIEDDLLMTEKGALNLTQGIVKEVSEIEKIMN